jgi:hypothetical protein
MQHKQAPKTLTIKRNIVRWRHDAFSLKKVLSPSEGVAPLREGDSRRLASHNASLAYTTSHNNMKRKRVLQ